MTFYGMLVVVIERNDFVGELRAAVPEARGSVTEHFADNEDELLLHPLMSDLLRLTIVTFADGRLDTTDQLLAFVDRCLREGDEDVVNAVAVSFVEDFGAYAGESDELLDRWPPRLRAELGR
ncbi:MAG: hypothetical protein QM638_12155 [Nocardioides sp.]